MSANEKCVAVPRHTTNTGYPGEIHAPDGRIYPIGFDAQGRYMVLGACGVPTIQIETKIPFQNMTVDAEHAAILQLLRDAMEKVI